MKIAFISTILGYPWGGADTLWTHAAEAASERGDKLFLSVSPAVAAHPRIAQLQACGAQIHLRTPPAAPTLPVRALRKLGFPSSQTDHLLGALQEFRPDRVIISLGGTYDLVLHASWLTWFAASRTPYHLIANWQQEHPVLAPDQLELARHALTFAERLYFVSSRNLAVTRRHLLAALPQALVVQNPLRWRATDVTPWPEAPGPLLATVSRLDHGKGIRLLLHSLAELITDADWRLAIYGQGPHEQALRDAAASLGLATRVSFRGYVKELSAIWREQQLFVSPAIDDGVPMTIPEALLCARPVLATCVGGAEDWIQPGRTGFLCPAPTVPLLTASLREAFAAHARWPAMGVEAAKAAAGHYRPDDFRQLLS
ncbi:MAG: glycosyltransferase [Candidatus Didemnitutus sp.]|nr:glycosyltransferase [Candidatus Didemnitutus sp.]